MKLCTRVKGFYLRKLISAHLLPMKLTFTAVIRDQWKSPPVQKADLSGRTVIVVGSNTCIGLDAVKHFANMSPGRIILACRNETKGKAAIEGTWIDVIRDFPFLPAMAHGGLQS